MSKDNGLGNCRVQIHIEHLYQQRDRDYSPYEDKPYEFKANAWATEDDIINGRKSRIVICRPHGEQSPLMDHERIVAYQLENNSTWIKV